MAIPTDLEIEAAVPTNGTPPSRALVQALLKEIRDELGLPDPLYANVVHRTGTEAALLALELPVGEIAVATDTNKVIAGFSSGPQAIGGGTYVAVDGSGSGNTLTFSLGGRPKLIRVTIDAAGLEIGAAAASGQSAVYTVWEDGVGMHNLLEGTLTLFGGGFSEIENFYLPNADDTANLAITWAFTATGCTASIVRTGAAAAGLVRIAGYAVL